MERVTISLDDDLMQAFDSYLERKGYANRSEGVRDAIRQLLSEEQLDASDDQKCVGCLVYVYNHHERLLSSRLVEAQHQHHDIPAATLHLHIDHDNCLEATILNGNVAQVRGMADEITAQTGVKHGKLHLIPVEDKKEP